MQKALFASDGVSLQYIEYGGHGLQLVLLAGLGGTDPTWFAKLSRTPAP